MPLFEVAIIEAPTKDQREEGELEKLLVAPTTVIARDEQSAAIKVALADGSADLGNKDRMEVLVRPFVGEEE